MNAKPITTSQLFVAQTHLSLDDPEGQYTAGTPSEVADWIANHIVAATEVPPCGNVPTHLALALADGSELAIVPTESANTSARIACMADITRDADWTGDGPAWVWVGEQPGAARYLEVLYHVMVAAPHPAEVVRATRAQPYNTWADSMLSSAAGQHGTQANQAAQETWNSIQRQRGTDEERGNFATH